MKRLFWVGLLSASSATCLLADISYTQSTKFTGGTLLDMMRRMANNNPAVGRRGGAMRNGLQDQMATVYIKGNKMARVGDKVSVIFDLDAGTMTSVNNETHTYNVRSFDEVRQQAEQMQQRRNNGQSGHMDFDVKAEKTGQTRTIGGQTATETLLTLTAKSSGPNGQMVVKVDAWTVPADAATRELVDFSKRLMEKFSYAVASPGMGSAGAAIAAANKESLKLDGVPVLRDTTISGVSFPMGGPMSNGNNDANAPFLQIESEDSNFAGGPVDDSKFTVPAGYTQEQMQH